MKKIILKWLWIGVLGTIILHILLWLGIFIHALIPGSICSNIEGFSRHPCTFSEAVDVLKSLPLFLEIVVGFSYGLSLLMPFVLIFTGGIAWSYIKKRKASSNIVH